MVRKEKLSFVSQENFLKIPLAVKIVGYEVALSRECFSEVSVGTSELHNGETVE